ncbi:hypothetical protein C8Q78DRAFT_356916 [Trametes maxima]|nr:hypothetical protein C8Q78DRAFT_356916 [Trametes maxima]
MGKPHRTQPRHLQGVARVPSTTTVFSTDVLGFPHPVSTVVVTIVEDSLQLPSIIGSSPTFANVSVSRSFLPSFFSSVEQSTTVRTSSKPPAQSSFLTTATGIPITSTPTSITPGSDTFDTVPTSLDITPSPPLQIPVRSSVLSLDTPSFGGESQSLSVPTSIAFLSSSSVDITTESQTSLPAESSSGVSNLGPILGGGVGGTVLLAMALILVRCLVLERRKRSHTHAGNKLTAVDSDYHNNEVKPQEDSPGHSQASDSSSDLGVAESSLYPRGARPNGAMPRELARAGTYPPVWGERQSPPLVEQQRRATFSSLTFATNESLSGDSRYGRNSSTPAPSYHSRSTLPTEGRTVLLEHPLDPFHTPHLASPILPTAGSVPHARDVLMRAAPVGGEDANHDEGDGAKGAEALVRWDSLAISLACSEGTNGSGAVSDDPPPAYEP